MIEISFNFKEDMRKMAAICIFKKGIPPAWEEHINHFGGDFSAVVKSSPRERFKEIWDKLVLRLIGSYFKYSENVKNLQYTTIDYRNKSS